MTTSATTGGQGELPELAELEAALADLVEVLRPRAALVRQFKEVARHPQTDAGRRPRIDSDAKAEQLRTELEAEAQLFADRLRPVAQGLAALAPDYQRAVTRFDAAARSLVLRCSGVPLPPEQQSEADEALDGVLELLSVLSVRPWAETSALFTDHGNADLRAILGQLTSAFRSFDDQHDVLIALGEPIRALPGRQLPPGVSGPRRPMTAPELLVAEAAEKRWFDAVRLWSEATRDFYLAAEAARAESAALRESFDRAGALRHVASMLAPACDRLLAAATQYAGRTTDLDAAARVLLEHLTAGELSDADRRTATSLLEHLRDFAANTADVGDYADDAGDPETDSSIGAAVTAFGLVQSTAPIIAGWAGLMTDVGTSST